MEVALGCMRLSARDEGADERAIATIAAALEAGITLFDTAHAYGRDEGDLGHNEALLARALKRAGAGARIVTKGGMRRAAGRWIPDGRAAAIRADCEQSLRALDGLPIDLYLLHAPDPATSWSTSVRALRALADEGLVRGIGVCNVNRRQLDEALAEAPLCAVQVALGPHDDVALRGGVVARCAERGLTLLAHSPLGGPERAARLAKDPVLAAIARRHGVGAAEVFLAALLVVDPCVVPVPGARRPETARSAAHATRLMLDEADRAALAGRFGSHALARGPRAPETLGGAEGEVVLVMGIPGSGKSEVAARLVALGHERLNRDERGGTLRGLAQVLDARLAAGAGRTVLDNTYVTRASRRDVIEVAWRHGRPVRALWLDTPVPQAQVNVIHRMLDAHGRLLEPEEMARSRDPTGLAPSAVFRAQRELEPPSLDEGFSALEVVAFERRAIAGHDRAGRFLALEALIDASGELRPGAERLLGDDPDVPRLVFAWRPATRGPFGAEVAVCPHEPGPPRCWCRPPLPGLLLRFARAERVDPARSVLIGSSPTHRSMAAALGMRFEGV